MRRFAAINADRLLAINARLGDAAIDPAIWPEIMQEISSAVGATGAALLQSDVRTSDVPRTPSVDEALANYFAGGWHLRDVRAERCVPLLLHGDTVVTDQDLFTPDEMRRSELYAETLEPYGLQWFAVIGFRSGSALWCLSIQRSKQEGPFEVPDKRILTQLSQRLTETATLSKAVGRTVISGVTNALQLVQQPAIALDRLGFVLDANGGAEQIFDEEFRVKNRRLYVCDPRAKSALDAFTRQLHATSDKVALPVAPIVVKRRRKPPLVIRVLPIDGAARSPFLGARALLVFSDLKRKSGPDSFVLSQAFGLSTAEARLASLMASGISPEQAAEELGIARATARNQLKAVFAKTDTHRQGQLVALLSRL